MLFIIFFDARDVYIARRLMLVLVKYIKSRTNLQSVWKLLEFGRLIRTVQIDPRPQDRETGGPSGSPILFQV